MSAERKSGCPTNKVRFKTQAEALRFHDRRYPNTYRRAYRCFTCKRWHLSSTPLKDVGVVKAMKGRR